MFISDALAQGAAPSTGGLGALLPLVLIFVIFYFLLIRPQQKKMKAHREMLASARRGDRVVTGGGIIGTITKVVGETEVVIEIAPDVKVHVQRHLIADILSKTEPAANDDAPKADGEKKKSGGLKSLLGGKKD